VLESVRKIYILGYFNPKDGKMVRWLEKL